MKYSVVIYILLSFNMVVMAQQCPTGEERLQSMHPSKEKAILDMVNEVRKENGLKALLWDQSLVYAARYHAYDMATENYMEHDSYDRKQGRLVKVCAIFDRIESFADYPYLAENISAGRMRAEDVMKGWLNSEGHRKNILNKNMTYLGVGYYYDEDSDYGYYWVQNFGGE